MQLRQIISRVRGESRTVGLDIGHRLIRVAVVEHKQSSEKGTLIALERDTIPEGVIVDNEIRNIPVLTERIQALLAKAMPDGIIGDFIISVNWTSGILCDKILVKPVPKVPESELILQTAMSRSPFDDAGNILDYFVLGRREEGVDAMIVAVKKEGLTPWLNLFQALNIKLFAIDVDTFVLTNTYLATAVKSRDSMMPEDEDDSVLILNLGYSKSYAAFLRGNTFGTARSIFGAGLQDLQEQLSGPLGIPADRCGELLIGSDVKEAGLDEAKIKAALDFIFEEIAMKVDTALRYFSSVDNYMKPSKIVVTGGGSNITGLVSFLADRLSMDTVKLNPFKAIEMDPTRFFVKDADKDSGIYTVALGLALRRF